MLLNGGRLRDGSSEAVASLGSSREDGLDLAVGASGLEAGGDGIAEGLEVGALAGQVLDAGAAVGGGDVGEALVAALGHALEGEVDAAGGNGGDGDGGAGGANGGGAGGDAEAAAGRGVGVAVGAGRGISRDGSRGGGDLAGLDLTGNDGGARGDEDGGGDGAGGRSHDNGLEGRAVGRAGGKGREAGTGASHLAVAVVAGAGTLLDDGGEAEAGEGEDDGGLHLEGLSV